MAFKRNNPGCANDADCEACCIWETDNFNRSAATGANLKPRWNMPVPEEGDWSIDSGELKCTAANRVIGLQEKNLDPPTDPETEGRRDTRGKVRVKGTADGDQMYLQIATGGAAFRVRLQVDSTCGEMLVERFEFGQPSYEQLALIPVPGATLNTFHELRLCLDTCPDDSGCWKCGSGDPAECDVVPKIWASVITSDGQIYTHVSDLINTEGGLDAGGGDALSLATVALTGTAYFDDFEAATVSSLDAPNCPECSIPETCDIFSTTFTGADSSDIGCEWSEVVGSWERKTNQLKVTTASAVAQCLIPHPRSTPNWHVTCTAQADTSGDQARVIVDYLNEQNYQFVEVTFGGSATMKLFTRAGGSNIQKGSTINIVAQVNTVVVITLCLIGDKLSAIVDGESAYSETATVTRHDGAFCGLGTGTLNGTSVLFDFFDADVGLSALDLSCPHCSIGGNCQACITGSGPAFWKLVVTGFADGTNCAEADCDGLNKTTIMELVNTVACREFVSETACGITITVDIDISGDGIGDTSVESEYTFDAFPGQVITFGKSNSGPLDCKKLLDYDIPFSSDFPTKNHCDPTNVKVALTSIN